MKCMFPRCKYFLCQKRTVITGHSQPGVKCVGSWQLWGWYIYIVHSRVYLTETPSVRHTLKPSVPSALERVNILFSLTKATVSRTLCLAPLHLWPSSWPCSHPHSSWFRHRFSCLFLCFPLPECWISTNRHWLHYLDINAYKPAFGIQVSIALC